MFRLTAIFLFFPVMVAGNTGVVDTIGGTTADNLLSGPAWRMLANSPGHGIHAIWMHSADTDFPYLYVRYNFYDDSLRSWGTDVNVFTVPAGYGSLDVDTSGVAVISAHHTTGSGPSDLAPIVARDVEPGAGVFDYSPGEPTLDGYVWPCLGVGTNGYYHLAMIGAATQDNLCWSRSTTWQNWDSAMGMSPPAPEPLFPTHNIAASKVSGSGRVCITWVATPASGYAQMPGFYRESPDGGQNWNQAESLGFPPAFSPGSDTLPSFHITSLFPFYDRLDRLHIVCNVSPFVRDTNWANVSEIWHFCPDNTPQWARIHRAGTHSLLAPMGYGATYACRPSIGADESGGLHVVWEQFDSANVEPGPPERLRADIFYAQDSGDNGASWRPGVRVSEQGTWTCRFPSAIDHFEGDTFRMLYLVDQHAGFWQYGEGPPTYNPVVVHKVPVASQAVADRDQPSANLKPVATIVCAVLYAGHDRNPPGGFGSCPTCVLLDVNGRKVMDLRPGANDVRALAPGVYFVLRKNPWGQGFEDSRVTKVVIQR